MMEGEEGVIRSWSLGISHNLGLGFGQCKLRERFRSDIPEDTSYNYRKTALILL